MTKFDLSQIKPIPGFDSQKWLHNDTNKAEQFDCPFDVDVEIICEEK